MTDRTRGTSRTSAERSNAESRPDSKAESGIGRRPVLRLLGAAAIPFAAQGVQAESDSDGAGYGAGGYGEGGYGESEDSDDTGTSGGTDDETGDETDGSSDDETDDGTDDEPDPYEPVVETEPPIDVTPSSATLRGELVDDDGADGVKVSFTWRRSGGDWQWTAPQSLGATERFSETIDGLASETDYEVRAVVDAGDGEQFGDPVAFTTDAEESIGKPPKFSYRGSLWSWFGRFWD